MKFLIYTFVFILWASPLHAEDIVASDRVVTLDNDEEVTIHQFPATFKDQSKPLVIWFTEGYAQRKPFKQLITDLNDEGYPVWQVDLLESYFIERTPNNVRKLSGKGVAAVIAQAEKLDMPFVPISTGRMSLILLRGLRQWQLTQPRQYGIGLLQQTVLFFPNLFAAPQKAGEAPALFPIAHSSSLPITIVQPEEGTYKWKLDEIQQALQNNGSQITLVGVPKVRDWYFLRRDPSDVEKQAGNRIASHLGLWLQASAAANTTEYVPEKQMPQIEVTQSVKGLVGINSRPAPNFKLTDISGLDIDLADKQGKVILLNFWASWCPPCVKEIPSMNRLAESYNAKDFEIVSVNFKESPQTIRDFLKQVKVDFPVLVDQDGKVSAQYEIFAFPSSFLIDRQGNLRYSVNSAIEWDDAGVKQVINSLVE